MEGLHQGENAHEADYQYGGGVRATCGKITGQRENTAANTGRDHDHDQTKSVQTMRIDDAIFPRLMGFLIVCEVSWI